MHVTDERNPTNVGFLARRLTQLVLRGLSTAEVSEELHITPNTVRDHFKSIFDKVGVRSRRELVGQVFAQHYQPRMVTGHEPNADGWFA